MKISPLGKRVLIRPVSESEEVKGGIIIPDSAREKPQMGEVVAVGTADDFTVKVGDTVLLPKYGGAEVKLNDEVHQLVNEDDILGITK